MVNGSSGTRGCSRARAGPRPRTSKTSVSPAGRTRSTASRPRCPGRVRAPAAAAAARWAAPLRRAAVTAGRVTSPPARARREHAVDDARGGAEVVAGSTSSSGRGRDDPTGGAVSSRMLRRSASSADGLRWTTRAPSAPVSTCRPSSSSAVCEAATRVRRDSVASVAHSVCQPPSGRSSTASAAARWSWAASPGAASAARRTSTRQHGVGLLRHRRGAAAALDGRLGQLADLGTGEQQHVVGDVPERVGGAHQRVGVRREGGADGVPRRGRRRGPSDRATSSTTASAASGAAGELGDRGEGARGPADLHREAAAPRRSSRASSTPWSHCAALSPKVIGTACWVSVRPAIRSSRCRSARVARAATCRSRSASSCRVAARAPSTSAVSSDVLAGQAAVQPARGLGHRPPAALAQQGQQRHDGVAARLGPGGDQGRRRRR